MQLAVGLRCLSLFTLIGSNVWHVQGVAFLPCNPSHYSSVIHFLLLVCVYAFYAKRISTWSLDTVTEVFSKVVNNVQQEGEVSNIVHVDIVRIRSNRPQFILISILYT